MGQLLVREVEDALVQRLKRRAAAQGLSTEELHRRILREALSREENGRATLIEFLISPEGEVAPDLELEWSRPRDTEIREIDLS